jgi:GYF domain 2
MRPHSRLIGWYYVRDGQHFGPFSPADITRLLKSGVLCRTDMLVEIASAPAGDGAGVRYDYQDVASVALSS